MFRFSARAAVCGCGAALAILAFSSNVFAEASDSSIESIVVTDKHLGEGRAFIQTQAGASTYVIDEAAIAALPGGDNQHLNPADLRTANALFRATQQLILPIAHGVCAWL
jgi:hypothetical protein